MISSESPFYGMRIFTLYSILLKTIICNVAADVATFELHGSHVQTLVKEGVMPRQTPDSPVQHEQVTKPQNASLQDETLYTVGEVAKRLRVDTTTVRRWIAIGTLEAVILPHKGKRQAYRIRQGTLDKLLRTPGSSVE